MKGHLFNVDITNHRITGEYQGATGSIQFFSEITDTAKTISITKPGESPVVISARMPQNSNVLIMRMRENVFIADGSQTARRQDSEFYHVPQDIANQVETAVIENVALPYSFLQNLDLNVDTKKRFDLLGESLALSQDVDLVVAAAQALGERGVIGSENPAALQFYSLAMNLQKMRGRIQRREEQRYKAYATAVETENAEKCPASSTACWKCKDGSCKDICKDECFGLCGYGCSCWSYLCNDCCYHKGCYDHDICCRDEYSFWSCYVWAPFYFECDKPYEC